MLDDHAAANATPRASAYKMAAGQGVFLFVSSTGFKSWRVKFRAAGKERLMVLGSFPMMSADEARGAALAARSAARTGKAPRPLPRSVLLHREMLDRLHAVPAEELRRVYFIQANSGPIKIGVSVDVSSRLAKLQCAHPSRLNLLGTMRGGYASEFIIHSMFAEDRLEGEWFRPSERLLEFVQENICP